MLELGLSLAIVAKQLLNTMHFANVSLNCFLQECNDPVFSFVDKESVDFLYFGVLHRER